MAACRGMTIVGIDGGGTRTRIAFERDGQLQFIERPVSMKVRNGNYLASAQTLVGILGEAIQHDIGSIAIGLSGMSQPLDQKNLESALRSFPLFANTRIHIEGDASLAINAALGASDDGMLLIAGTGSVAFARKNGKLFRAGGWGPTLSDEGSGYWIGLHALRHYIRSIDGADEIEDLSYAVGAALPEDMRSNLAAIVRCVIENASFPATLAHIPFEQLQVSQRAREIIHNAALELEKLVLTARSAAQLPSPTPLFLHGSIATQHVIVAELRRALDEREFRISMLEAEAGARYAVEVVKSL